MLDKTIVDVVYSPVKENKYMSNPVNSLLIERANGLLEEIASHPSGYDKLLSNALKQKDLDEVYRIVCKIEAELARSHYTNYDLIVY